MNDKEKKLIAIISEEFYEFLDSSDSYSCQYIDTDLFASYTEEIIENIYGELEFDDFNIKSYAKDFAETYLKDLEENFYE